MKRTILAFTVVAMTLSTGAFAKEGLGNLWIDGQKVVYDYTNELCWYPYLPDTLYMSKDKQEGFIAGISAAEYGGITDWQMATWEQVQDMKDSLAAMGEMLTEHAWPWVPPGSPRDPMASPFLAWSVQVDEFFTPTAVISQPMFDMPMDILGGYDVMFFNGRTVGWGWRSNSPLEPPVWAEGEADDHFVTTEFKTPGKFATMTWNYDQHYLADDATTRDGFPGDFGAWIVSTAKPTAAYLIVLDDSVKSMKLHYHVKKRLVAMLKNAIRNMELGRANSVAYRLKGFIHAVEAQRGNKITHEQADILVADALAIIDMLRG